MKCINSGPQRGEYATEAGYLRARKSWLNAQNHAQRRKQKARKRCRTARQREQNRLHYERQQSQALIEDKEFLAQQAAAMQVKREFHLGDLQHMPVEKAARVVGRILSGSATLAGSTRQKRAE